MAATWTPASWMHKYFGDHAFVWKQKFVWWPQHSYESNKRIWLKKAWYGYRLAYGPAGEEPVKIERWLTDDEYMWAKLSQPVGG